MEHEASFFSDGYKLWAQLLLPAGLEPGERRPAIIECPGFRHGATDSSSLGRRASTHTTNLLLEAGFIVLIPHCRGMGKSEGRPGYENPRARLNPFEQIEDLRNAITYLQQRSDVDPEQIGAYGFSYGGALSPYLAAVDRRVKCCVGALGVGDGTEWMRGIRRDWEFRALKERVANDLRDQVLTGQPEFVDPLEILLTDPASMEVGRAHPNTAYAGLQFTLDSAHYIMNFKTVDVADQIACPLLIIGGEDDSLCPVDDFVKVFEKAREPKKLVIMPGTGHYDTYLPENIDKAAIPLVEWFSQWLPVAGQTAQQR